MIGVQIQPGETLQEWANFPNLLHQDLALARRYSLWLHIARIVAIYEVHNGIEPLFFRQVLLFDRLTKSCEQHGERRQGTLIGLCLLARTSPEL